MLPSFTFFPFKLINIDQVIPRAVDYFTGKALEYEEDEGDFDDDDDDDEDDEDQDIESSGSGSEQDSESDSYVPGRGGGRGEAPQKVRHSTNSNPEECKQQ